MELNGSKCVMVIDFSNVAQSCNVYDDYIQKAATVEESGFQYFGIELCGDKKLVNKLTGSLPLLRQGDTEIMSFCLCPCQ